MMPSKRVTAVQPESKSGHMKPAGKSSGSAVGNERGTNVKAAQTNMPSDGLKGAMAELTRQHPMRPDDLPGSTVGKGRGMKGA